MSDMKDFTPDEAETHLIFWYSYEEDDGTDPSYQRAAREMIDKIKADAWDEGRSAGHHDRDNYRLHHNPYRKE